jgi:hypothetical protein
VRDSQRSFRQGVNPWWTRPPSHSSSPPRSDHRGSTSAPTTRKQPSWYGRGPGRGRCACAARTARVGTGVRRLTLHSWPRRCACTQTRSQRCKRCKRMRKRPPGGTRSRVSCSHAPARATLSQQPWTPGRRSTKPRLRSTQRQLRQLSLSRLMIRRLMLRKSQRRKSTALKRWCVPASLRVARSPSQVGPPDIGACIMETKLTVLCNPALMRAQCAAFTLMCPCCACCAGCAMCLATCCCPCCLLAAKNEATNTCVPDRACVGPLAAHR